MNTPRPKYFCPRCRAVFDEASNYCGRCGADMQRASGLERAAMEERREPTDADRDRRGFGDRDRWLGRVIDNRYRVIEVIGRGGMGVVYKVEHQRMGKIAAMKVLHGELAHDPEVTGRFRREAEAVSRLDHPNTVQVFDFGTVGDALYLIMEYVRGLDLSSLLERDGPLPFSRAAPLFGQVCAALGEAHALGIVHRDLKPENILVTRTHGGRDFVKVLDFGLAKLTERPELAEVTDRGSIVGTPYFMSPEQIRGEDVDARSDIYSLGALMYRVLTGRHPYTAKTPVGVLTKHLTASLVPPSERRPELRIDPRVDGVLLRAMARDRARRHQTAADLLADIENLFHRLSDESGPVSLPGVSMSRHRSTSQAEEEARRMAADVDYGIDSEARLRRSDLDLYERSLRRRRLLLTFLVPSVLIATAAGALYLLFFRPEAPHTREREPNDELDEATLVAADSAVSGHIGKRISKSEPDRDWFRVTPALAPDGSETISAHVTGVPNMDVTLSLYDATGRLLAQRDAGGVGDDEWIHRRRATGLVYVLVGQDAPGGPRLPIENVSDAYTLSITIEPDTPELEAEPNESRADASPLAPGRAISGTLDHRDDTDVYRFAGDAGSYRITIDGAAAVPIEWTAAGGAPRTERSATVELRPGDLVVLERADRELDPQAPLPGAGQSYSLSVEPAS